MCDTCGEPGHNPGKMMYKCSECEFMSETPGEHHGKAMDMVCDCGSGKWKKDCCQPE